MDYVNTEILLVKICSTKMVCSLDVVEALRQCANRSIYTLGADEAETQHTSYLQKENPCILTKIT